MMTRLRTMQPGSEVFLVCDCASLDCAHPVTKVRVLAVFREENEALALWGDANARDPSGLCVLALDALETAQEVPEA